MNLTTSIRIAQTIAAEPEQAAQELYAGLVQEAMTLVIFFAPIVMSVADWLRLFSNCSETARYWAVPLLAKSDPQVYNPPGLTGVSFSTAACVATAGLLTDLKYLEIPQLHQFARQQLLDFQTQSPSACPGNSFGILLIDGLSVREEPVSAALQAELGDVPLVGGSAGDGLRFDHTFVYFNGAFHHDSAALILINTPLPFRIFKTQHFVPTEERMVVTVADVRQRVVHEINGRPAAPEYARLIAADVTDLNPRCFAKSPVVVMINGNYYVRSIQQVNPDGSLTFYCAIEVGLVLRVASGERILENLRLAFDNFREQSGLFYSCPISLILSQGEHYATQTCQDPSRYSRIARQSLESARLRF